MSSVKVECVIKEKCEIGESPVWEEKEGTLLYVDISGRRVCRWNPATNKIQSIRTGEPMSYIQLALIKEGFNFRWTLRIEHIGNSLMHNIPFHIICREVCGLSRTPEVWGLRDCRRHPVCCIGLGEAKDHNHRWCSGRKKQQPLQRWESRPRRQVFCRWDINACVIVSIYKVTLDLSWTFNTGWTVTSVISINLQWLYRNLIVGA